MIFKIPTLPNEYVEVVEKIGKLRTQLRYATQQQPRCWTGLLRRSSFARAIQASNSIEGYNVTYEDAVAAVEGEEPIDEKTEAWRAVSGYRAAMSYILQLADDPFYVHNEGTIRSLHYMMVSFDITKHPGRWRPGGIFVRREPTNEIVYEGPDVGLVPTLMTELINAMNEPSNVPVMVRAAMAHLVLVMIHPFSDGNGRMGRALQTMVLAREGILDPRFSSIEEYLGHNSQEYYTVLGQVGQGAWHPENDVLPWIRFCLIAHYRQAETLLRRLKEMERVWEMVDVEIRNRGLNDRTLLVLVDAASGYRVRNAIYRATAEISDEVASKDLRTLVKEGLLVPNGEKRGRYYTGGTILKDIRRRSREDKIVTDPFFDTRQAVLRREPQQEYLPGFRPR
jgi:Fic family protein